MGNYRMLAVLRSREVGAEGLTLSFRVAIVCGWKVRRNKVFFGMRGFACVEKLESGVWGCAHAETWGPPFPLNPHATLSIHDP